MPFLLHGTKASVTPRVSATRQVIQIDGFAFSLSPITRVKGAQVVMPQSFCPLNTEKEHTLLTKGEEITTPQAIRASNFRVPRVHVH